MASLNIGEIIRDAIGTMGKYPVLLFIGAIATLPSLFMGSGEDLRFFILLVVSLFVDTYCVGLIVKFLADSRDRVPLWADINRFLIGKYWALFTVYFGLLAIVMFGLVLLIIPGVFFWVRLCMCDYGILLEGEGIVPSIKRSWDITRGHWWQVFLLNVIGFMPLFITLPFANVMPGPIYALVSLIFGTFGFIWVQVIFINVYFRLRRA